MGRGIVCLPAESDLQGSPPATVVGFTALTVFQGSPPVPWHPTAIAEGEPPVGVQFFGGARTGEKAEEEEMMVVVVVGDEDL